MRYFFLFLIPVFAFSAQVKLGVDRYFQTKENPLTKDKRIGLITNHTGVDSQLRSTIDLFKKEGKLVAIFSPEHGVSGAASASEKIEHSRDKEGLRIYSLHGETRRPTEEMLKGIDLLIYDIQEIGCRSYTYISTLFYVMEEAAKKSIPVIVLDRPNPMGGLVVDGPMMEEKWRSFLGYINIPYCHGMTIGELALFFNGEYKVGCNLHVVTMQGWRRVMTFSDTGLAWIPTSPYIPEPDTPFYYATTGVLGNLGVVNIGIGYTLPFKVIGAPWIDAAELATRLNGQKLPGVTFLPFHYRPFYGKFKTNDCNGVKIVITNPTIYKPMATQYMLIGVLKSLYPKEFESHVNRIGKEDKASFCKVNGTERVLDIILKEKYIAWKLVGLDSDKRNAFLEVRKKYLIYD